MLGALSAITQGEYLKNEAYAKIISEVNLDAASKRASAVSPTSGCMLYKVKTESGKSKPTYIYTASYLKYDEASGTAKAKQIIMCVLWLAAAALHAFTMYIITVLDSPAWIQIIDSVAALVALYLAYTLLVQITAPENKTLYKYAVGSNRLKVTALGLSVLYFIGFAVMLCYAVFSVYRTKEDLTALAMQLCAAIAVIAIFVIEIKRKVTTVENDYVIPENAVLVEEVYNA